MSAITTHNTLVKSLSSKVVKKSWQRTRRKERENSYEWFDKRVGKCLSGLNPKTGLQLVPVF